MFNRNKVLMTIMALLMLLGSFRTTVSAAEGNYKDEIFSFYVDSTQETRPRDKKTTSSVYVYLTESDTGFAKVLTMGEIDGQWVNKTIGGYAILPRDYKRRVKNTILESNNEATTSTKLRFPVYLSYTPIGGLWSPDCAGNYDPAN